MMRAVVGGGLLCAVASMAAPARGLVDMTGSWRVTISTYTCTMAFTQTGTALAVAAPPCPDFVVFASFDGMTGEIDPMTGAFNLATPASNPLPLTVSGTVAVTGRTFAGTVPLRGFPIAITGVRDGDTDGDGLTDDVDNCYQIPNVDQADADGDGLGDVCDACVNDPANDQDNDGVCGDVDNCPSVANPGQEDVDGDGIGDQCDGDRDGDGLLDAAEPDYCRNSQPGAPVTAIGCTVDQVCPCAAPLGRSAWNRRREYLGCVRQALQELRAQHRISRMTGSALHAAANANSCDD